MGITVLHEVFELSVYGDPVAVILHKDAVFINSRHWKPSPGEHGRVTVWFLNRDEQGAMVRVWLAAMVPSRFASFPDPDPGEEVNIRVLESFVDGDDATEVALVAAWYRPAAPDRATLNTELLDETARELESAP